MRGGGWSVKDRRELMLVETIKRTWRKAVNDGQSQRDKMRERARIKGQNKGAKHGEMRK